MVETTELRVKIKSFVTMQVLRQRNEKLSKDLESSQTDLQDSRAKLEAVKMFTREAHSE